jgi:hypothetical protein
MFLRRGRPSSPICHADQALSFGAHFSHSRDNVIPLTLYSLCTTTLTANWGQISDRERNELYRIDYRTLISRLGRGREIPPDEISHIDANRISHVHTAKRVQNQTFHLRISGSWKSCRSGKWASSRPGEHRDSSHGMSSPGQAPQHALAQILFTDVNLSLW